MSAVPSNITPLSVKPNQVLIVGRIDHIRDWEGQDSSGYVQRVRLPAASEYDSAALVEVSSRRKLGKVGEEIKVLCSVSGWLKRGKGNNGPYEIVNMRLTAAE